MMRARCDSNTESGMSLVELIVACLVSALLLGVIAVIFAQGLGTQQQQASRDAATGKLNAISAQLNESMRAAVAAQVSEAGSRIDMKVLNSAGTGFECRSWKLKESVAGNDALKTPTLWYSHGSSARGAWNSTAWKKLASNLQNPATTIPFVQTGNTFSYFLTLRDGDVSVTIRDGGYPGTRSTLGGPTC